MIDFARPELLWLAVPATVAWWFFRRAQRRAVAWADAHVDPRFRATVTTHDDRSMRRHTALLGLLGALLVVGAAGPRWTGRGEVTVEAGRLLIVVDGSASMYAVDVPSGTEPEQRFATAQRLASEVALGLPGWEVGVASFSGTGTIHLPLVRDDDLLAEALRVLEPHTFYQSSGSSFTVALDLALGMVGPDVPDLQVLLLSDGEQPVEEDLDAPLRALDELSVPVHSIAIGSTDGQSRLIYDFADVVAGKPPEERRVLREYTTARVDRHLRTIARQTGGAFGVAGPEAVGRIIEAIDEHRREGETVEDADLAHDLAVWCLWLFSLGFLVDRLLIGRQDPPDYRYRLPALGITLVAALGLGSCDTSPHAIAHRENEAGIALDRIFQHERAAAHYRRAIGLTDRPALPTYNLARSTALDERYAEAHELYQEAITLQPTLGEAYFNDGHALFDWGVAERDPRECELERTADLWRQAARRFDDAVVRAEDDDLADRARSNRRAIAAATAEIEALIAEPPEHCRSNSSSDDPSAGDEGGEPSGGGGAPPSDQTGSSGPDDTGDQPPPPGGSDDPGEPNGGDPPPSPDPTTPPPPAGGGDPPPGREGPDGAPGGGAGGSGGGELTPDELDQIEQEIERIRAQAEEGDRFHRRSRAEQFGPEQWEDPEPVIWW